VLELIPQVTTMAPLLLKYLRREAGEEVGEVAEGGEEEEARRQQNLYH
jgi:hypothetical protein